MDIDLFKARRLYASGSSFGEQVSKGRTDVGVGYECGCESTSTTPHRTELEAKRGCPMGRRGLRSGDVMEAGAWWRELEHCVGQAMDARWDEV